MKKLKKQISGIFATTATLLFSALSPFASASATTTSILLGDANGDGVVDLADATCIYQYLGGAYVADAKLFTAMDVNEDGIIDKTDEYMIKYNEAYSNTYSKVGTVVTKAYYNLPQNMNVIYRRHDCSDENLKSYKTYTIPLAESISSANFSSYSSDINTKDTENVACVEVFSNGVWLGSGFIISNDTIATAAHCIYNSTSGNFLKDITVKVHTTEVVNGKSKNVTYTAVAEFLHIPSGYNISAGGNNYNVNYDYGLIRVGDFKDENNKTVNVRNYHVNLGVMTDEFINAEKESLTSVGYTTPTGQEHTRYQSTGKISSSIPSEEYAYRYHIKAQTIGGKSGGMTYFDSKYTNPENTYTIDTRSTVGINTSGTGESGRDCYGVRITPNLLRFYYMSTLFEEE